MKYSLILLSLFVLAGCEQQFRYPCQNPENWDKDFCQKPICEINRDCPEHIFKEEKAKPAALPAAPAPVKGDCK